MSFRLVPKLVTLNDLEWCNGPYFVISPNLVASGVHWIKVVEEVTGQRADTPTRGLPTRGLDDSRMPSATLRA